jgi:hypothetical protein
VQNVQPSLTVYRFHKDGPNQEWTPMPKAKREASQVQDTQHQNIHIDMCEIVAKVEKGAILYPTLSYAACDRRVYTAVDDAAHAWHCALQNPTHNQRVFV